MVAGACRGGRRRQGEGYGAASAVPVDAAVEDETVRQRATTSHEFDPPEVVVATWAASRRPSPWRRFRFSWWWASTC